MTPKYRARHEPHKYRWIIEERRWNGWRYVAQTGSCGDAAALRLQVEKLLNEIAAETVLYPKNEP